MILYTVLFIQKNTNIAQKFALEFLNSFSCNVFEYLIILEIPYLPYIFGRIKIIIFFTVRTFNLEKKYKFFSVRILMNAEKLPIIEGIHRYICGNFNVYTDRCENKQVV